MKHLIQTTAEQAALKAAELIRQLVHETLAVKPVATIAFSGGSTPARMLRYLSGMDIDWGRVHIFQVDERIAPAGDSARNLVGLQKSLLENISLPTGNLHAMSVEANDLQAAAHDYADQLKAIAGDPPQLDIIHLGLGNDGHTASLPPGDDVLQSQRDVDICAQFNHYQRMTLNYPVINNAHHVLWLVSGQDKHAMLKRLLAADSAIPAGRVEQKNAILISDRQASGEDNGR